MTHVDIYVPMEGWAGPLEEAPDPVFANKTLGDGFLIDPTDNELRAPCSGEITNIPRTKHAVLLRAENGAEILMHIGIETVALDGAGFTVHVEVGQSVTAGDLLVTFDMDFLANRATSLLTPVIIANGDDYEISRHSNHGPVKIGDMLMRVQKSGQATGETQTYANDKPVSRKIHVTLTHGVHARPAATIAECAKTFYSQVEIITATEKRANARSPVALMTLAIKCGDEVTINATGPGAEKAAREIAQQLSPNSKNEHETSKGVSPSTAHSDKTPMAPVEDVMPNGPFTLRAATGAPGLVTGKTHRLQAAEFDFPENGSGIAAECGKLAQAIDIVRKNLETAAGGGGQQQEILTAHVTLLEDIGLKDDATRMIEGGKSAAFAWRTATRRQVNALQSLDDPHMAERAGDLIDLENQVLAILTGTNLHQNETIRKNAIIIADDLLPSQLVQLMEAYIAGICITGGGPTSHVSILAADRGIPTLVATDVKVKTIPDGTPVILDADRAQLTVMPDEKILRAVKNNIQRRRRNRDDALATASAECYTADNQRIEIFANLGSEDDAAKAVSFGAEGCGLLRTEFLFMGRTEPPGEAEQHQIYQMIADSLDGRPLVIRTLDIGSDKPVPFLDLPLQENPALGIRGIRLSLLQPDLLKTQYRAILRVRSQGPCHIMLPMVSSLREVILARKILDEVREELEISKPASLGIMIETPSSAIMAPEFAQVADFLSIGTNDLTQYVLATDRGNPALAHHIDSLDPAIIRLIKITADAGRKHNKWVGVCGALASDLVAAPILIGLGVTELSAISNRLPELKAFIRTLNAKECANAVPSVLGLSQAEEVREFVRTQWPHINDWA